MRYAAALFLLYMCTCGCKPGLLLTRQQLPVADTVNAPPGLIYSPEWRRFTLGHTPDTICTPYVQLMHGGKISVTTLAAQPDSVVTDKGAFALRDIVTYCNGKATYANVSRYTYLFGQHYDDLLAKNYGPAHSSIPEHTPGCIHSTSRCLQGSWWTETSAYTEPPFAGRTPTTAVIKG